jgi:hypothetical protein
MRGCVRDLRIPVSVTLLRRICLAFLAMQRHGAPCPDATLMEDLEAEIARAEWTAPPPREPR